MLKDAVSGTKVTATAPLKIQQAMMKIQNLLVATTKQIILFMMTRY
jgi:hypothetical protein